MKNDSKTVTIEIKQLERVAAYYKFPLAAFFVSKFPKGTRCKYLEKSYRRKLNKLKVMIDEILG